MNLKSCMLQSIFLIGSSCGQAIDSCVLISLDLGNEDSEKIHEVQLSVKT